MVIENFILFCLLKKNNRFCELFSLYKMSQLLKWKSIAYPMAMSAIKVNSS